MRDFIGATASVLLLPVAACAGWAALEWRARRLAAKDRKALRDSFRRDYAPARDQVVQILVGEGPPLQLSSAYFDTVGGWRDPETLHCGEETEPAPAPL